jgi:hypothetical protein
LSAELLKELLFALAAGNNAVIPAESAASATKRLTEAQGFIIQLIVSTLIVVTLNSFATASTGSIAPIRQVAAIKKASAVRFRRNLGSKLLREKARVLFGWKNQDITGN